MFGVKKGDRVSVDFLHVWGTVKSVSLIHGICHVWLDEPRALDTSSTPGLGSHRPHGKVELTKDFWTKDPRRVRKLSILELIAEASKEEGPTPTP